MMELTSDPAANGTIVPKNDDKGGDATKKTRNRKKKPKKEKSETSSSVPTAVPMNPHTILRNRLVDSGFTMSEVDKAMEEMWDKSLAYDEFDAVLAYLKGETTKATETDEASHDEKGTVASEAETEDKEESETSTPAPVMTLEERLDSVASFEPLTDAVFALTEWIDKAAKPRDLEDLCAATKTNALVKIFQRSITEAGDLAYFDGYILPSMARLMGSLLRKSGISAAGVSETQDAFEPLLRKARSIYLFEQPDAADFLYRVSRFIVSRISLAIGESNASTLLSLNGNGVQSNGSGPANGSDYNLAAVLTERESQMTAVKRYGAMISSLCALLSSKASASGATNGHSTPGEGIASSGVADIMLALVGEDTKASFELQKANLEELKAQVKSNESEKVQEIREAISELNEERGSIAQRILELKLSIEKLEAADAELSVKLNEKQGELLKETEDACEEAATLNKQIQKASDAIAYGSRVMAVAHSLKSYDDSLNRAIATSSKVGVTANGDVAALAGKQMEIFMTRSLKYFLVEAKAIAFVNNRIAESSKALEDLKSEIVDLEELGLTTTIGQMKRAAEKAASSIESDTAMVQRFKDDVTSNFDALVSRLNDYRSAQSVESLPAVSTSVVEQILAVARTLEVVSAARLDLLMNSSLKGGSDHANLLPTTSSSHPTEKAVSMNGHTPQKVSKAVEEPTASLQPKLTWASSSSKAQLNDGTKPSLLEIQKEELQSK